MLEGGPDLNGPHDVRLQRFRENFDAFRSAIVNEPRGSDVFYSRGGQAAAETGEQPLTQQLEGSSLLRSNATPDHRARNALTFLSYKEK